MSQFFSREKAIESIFSDRREQIVALERMAERDTIEFNWRQMRYKYIFGHDLDALEKYHKDFEAKMLEIGRW